MYFKEEAGIGGKTVIGGERVLEGRGVGIGSWGTSFGGKVRNIGGIKSALCLEGVLY